MANINPLISSPEPQQHVEVSIPAVPQAAKSDVVLPAAATIVSPAPIDAAVASPPAGDIASLVINAAAPQAIDESNNAPFDAPPMDEPVPQTPQPVLQPVSASATNITGNAATVVVSASPAVSVATVEASVGE